MLTVKLILVYKLWNGITYFNHKSNCLKWISQSVQNNKRVIQKERAVFPSTISQQAILLKQVVVQRKSVLLNNLRSPLFIFHLNSLRHQFVNSSSSIVHCFYGTHLFILCILRKQTPRLKKKWVNLKFSFGSQCGFPHVQQVFRILWNTLFECQCLRNRLPPAYSALLKITCVSVLRPAKKSGT